MRVKLYGARGSIPVSGRGYVKYGGNTTCLYVENDAGDPVVIDAGSGIREVGGQLIKNKKQEIILLFTHYHWDHIQGFPFFGPAYFKNTTLFIYGPSMEADVRKALSYQMTRPYFPTISISDMPARFDFKQLKNKVRVGSLLVETITNNHPNFTKGLKFTENGKCLVFLTDNEIMHGNIKGRFRKFADFVKKADVLIHDAQYTDEIYKTKIGWGHSTFSQVMQLAQESSVKHVVFTHHDPFSNDEFIDDIVATCSRAYPQLKIEAAREGMEFDLS
ncbi:MAG TPA: MBL fold metallo-hydrolase [bacterium]